MTRRLQSAGRYLLILSSVAGCVPAATRPWPTQSYPTTCPMTWMPREPVCLWTVQSGEGFAYNSQFAACRADMASFTHALDRWLECANEELVTKQNLFVDLAAKTLACLETEIPADEFQRSNTPSQCAIVDVDIDFFHFLDRHELPPFCIKDRQLLPRSRWDLSRCATEVAEHARKTKRMVEDGAWELRSKARRAADDAVKKFNCKARRERFCF